MWQTSPFCMHDSHINKLLYSQHHHLVWPTKEMVETTFHCQLWLNISSIPRLATWWTRRGWSTGWETATGMETDIMGETRTSRTTRTQPSLNCETLTTMQRSIHLWTEELVVAISTFHFLPGESLQFESIFLTWWQFFLEGLDQLWAGVHHPATQVRIRQYLLPILCPWSQSFQHDFRVLIFKSTDINLSRYQEI